MLKKLELPIRIGVAIVLSFIIMAVFFIKSDITTSEFYSIENHITADVTYADGSKKHFNDGKFGWIKRGDVAKISIQMPELKGEDSVNRELCIPLYNAVVSVNIDDRVLYSEDCDSGSIATHYGGRIYWVPLPPDYDQKTITMEIKSVEKISSSDMKKIGIIKAGDGWKHIIKGKSMIFCVSLSLMVLSLICIFFFMVGSIRDKKIHIGLPIAVFEIVINTWFFGSMGMFYLLVDNQEFCAKAEYYALYFSAIPLAVFIYLVLDVSMVKKFVVGVTCGYVVFYVVATAIELSSIPINYSTIMPLMHTLTGVIIITLVIAIFVGTKHEENKEILILRYGVLISMMCGVIELARFNIVKYVFEKTWFATHGLSVVAILVIAVSLVIYFISASAKEYTSKIEKQKLMEMAFRDALTDMPNRADFYRRIEQIESKDIKEYTMVFIDLNNLKTANDVYGHEVGDSLLKITAQYIKETFMDVGFCARWGGDEFVACVLQKKSEAVERINIFQNKMKEEDKKGTFSFRVSAACGYRSSDENDYLEPLNAIREADKKMYENKIRMKAQEKQ